MEETDQKIYETFFEFWDANYLHEPEHIKRIALRAWDAAVNGFTVDAFNDSEICDEAAVRGFEVRRKSCKFWRRLRGLVEGGRIEE